MLVGRNHNPSSPLQRVTRWTRKEDVEERRSALQIVKLQVMKLCNDISDELTYH